MQEDNETVSWAGGSSHYQKGQKFKNLHSTVQNNGELNNELISRTGKAWTKGREVSRVICNRRMPIKLKSKVYKMVIRPALSYGSECWALRQAQILNPVEIKI